MSSKCVVPAHNRDRYSRVSSASLAKAACTYGIPQQKVSRITQFSALLDDLDSFFARDLNISLISCCQR
jgi:hypothetical protein